MTDDELRKLAVAAKNGCNCRARESTKELIIFHTDDCALNRAAEAFSWTKIVALLDRLKAADERIAALEKGIKQVAHRIDNYDGQPLDTFATMLLELIDDDDDTAAEQEKQ